MNVPVQVGEAEKIPPVGGAVHRRTGEGIVLPKQRLAEIGLKVVPEKTLAHLDPEKGNFLQGFFQGLIENFRLNGLGEHGRDAEDIGDVFR